MEPIFAFAADWWWIAPTAVALGAVGYGALTTGRRRARRLELDAARHEEREARTALVAAKSRVRAAHADVLAARAQRVPAPGVLDASGARRALYAAKQDERSARLALRASHQRVKVAQTRYYATSSHGQLPLAELMAEHDAVTARWLDYETDAAKALAYPQLLDARHPATFAFLRANQEAQRLRPASIEARPTAAEFSAYRRAVREAEIAFDAAERDAHAVASGRPSPSEASAARASAAAAITDVVAALGDVAATVPDRLRSIHWREVFSADTAPRVAEPQAPAPAAPPPADAGPAAAPMAADAPRPTPATPDAPPQPVWPVPARPWRPPAEH